MDETKAFFFIEGFDQGGGSFVRIATFGVIGARFARKFERTHREALFEGTAGYGWAGGFVNVGSGSTGSREVAGKTG